MEMQCSEMAVSAQIFVYPTTSRGFFPVWFLEFKKFFT